MDSWFRRHRRAVLIFAAGLICRLIVSFAFYGSHDVRVQVYHGWLILNGQSAWTSKLPVAYFTPAAMYAIGETLHLPKDVAQELPAIAGDLFAAFLLMRIARRRGYDKQQWLWPAIFLLNPVTIVLSAYHGNIDPVMAAFMLWALDLRWRDKPVASGVAIGLAIAMKPTALLALPLLLIPIRRRGNFKLGATAILLPAAICAPFAYFDPTFGQFLKTYSGMYGNWGVPMMLRQTENVSKQLIKLPDMLVSVAHTLNTLLEANGKYILAAVMLVWLLVLVGRWTIDSFERNAVAMAATFLVFYIFATGFGPQYLSFVVPFLLIASTRIAVTHLALLSPYIILVYVHASLYVDPDLDKPITERLQSLTTADLALLWAHGIAAVLAWLACVWALWMLLRERRATRTVGSTT